MDLWNARPPDVYSPLGISEDEPLIESEDDSSPPSASSGNALTTSTTDLPENSQQQHSQMEAPKNRGFFSWLFPPPKKEDARPKEEHPVSPAPPAAENNSIEIKCVEDAKEEARIPVVLDPEFTDHIEKKEEPPEDKDVSKKDTEIIIDSAEKADTDFGSKETEIITENNEKAEKIAREEDAGNANDKDSSEQHEINKVMEANRDKRFSIKLDPEFLAYIEKEEAPPDYVKSKPPPPNPPTRGSVFDNMFGQKNVDEDELFGELQSAPGDDPFTSDLAKDSKHSADAPDESGLISQFQHPPQENVSQNEEPSETQYTPAAAGNPIEVKCGEDDKKEERIPVALDPEFMDYIEKTEAPPENKHASKEDTEIIIGSDEKADNDVENKAKGILSESDKKPETMTKVDSVKPDDIDSSDPHEISKEVEAKKDKRISINLDPEFMDYIEKTESPPEDKDTSKEDTEIIIGSDEKADNDDENKAKGIISESDKKPETIMKSDSAKPDDINSSGQHEIGREVEAKRDKRISIKLDPEFLDYIEKTDALSDDRDALEEDIKLENDSDDEGGFSETRRHRFVRSA